MGLEMPGIVRILALALGLVEVEWRDAEGVARAARGSVQARRERREWWCVGRKEHKHKYKHTNNGREESGRDKGGTSGKM